MRAGRSCRFNIITSLFKEFNNLGTMAKFTAKVKANIFIRDTMWETMLGEPAINIILGWFLGRETFAVESATIVVNDKAVTSLTIEASQAVQAFFILGLLNKKTIINREALSALSSLAGIGSRFVSTTKFGTETNRTFVEFSGNGYLWNTMGILVCIGDTTRVQMAKALMPKNTKLVASEMIQNKSAIIGSK